MVRKEDEQLTTVLASLINQIPQTLLGKERQEFIGNLVEQLPDQTKLFLRDALNTYLKKMRILEASDIELGGPGCNGHVWYRVYGEKKPDLSSRLWSFDETDILLQSILMKSQKEYLYRNRYVDFSYRMRLDDEW
ncbi:MAG: twitching motility protein PilT, partial [candidate division KSB1 bacterium]|nr:twitching motility protein PilT [candidate division KSB1 bacterium]